MTSVYYVCALEVHVCAVTSMCHVCVCPCGHVYCGICEATCAVTSVCDVSVCRAVCVRLTRVLWCCDICEGQCETHVCAVMSV